MIQKLHNTIGRRLTDILLITIGSLGVAIGFDVFLLPNKIVAGGINGLTIILNDKLGWTPSIVLLISNVVLLALCWIMLGKEVFSKSIYGSFAVPLFVSLLSGVDIGINEPILASIFGGLFIGTGVGLVYLGNGSTGGTSLLALLIQKFVDLRLGILLGICDGLVILSALFVFDIQTVLFALITLYLTSRMIDTVKVGPDFSKNLFVISTKYEAIREKLVTDLNCGVTYIPIEGGLNLDKSKMIMTVIREENFVDIKQAILDIDPEAFITIHSASEVVGRGFTLKKN
ncbi:hypothetical protein CBF34_04280 [Vagococcus penaei]|uniref:Uncharacterized protein n=1 Tax=Vagococcus penaei TaxID=633807 RepID=A0A1Q2D2Z5_9ENTE|nr:YitT family protein [Vagococcus penaei]AQP52757.1 hypothetical protein BW732_00020 [Vagococcus penaei]RSU05404.1 hypothetical protein CBF34_04280 [Vagococcus penaei]